MISKGISMRASDILNALNMELTNFNLDPKTSLPKDC